MVWIKEQIMADKNFLAGILVIALAFGFVVVGCENGTTDSGNGGGDSWSSVTSLSQLNGTWKGSYSTTMSAKAYFDYTDSDWQQSGINTFGNDMKITETTEATYTINANAKTRSGSAKQTVIFSGGKIATVWATIIKPALSQLSDPDLTVTFNDTQHSVTIQINSPSFQITESDEADMLSSGIQINQNGTKIKYPGDNSMPEMIMTKQ